ncbi:MAG TPA: alpha/beta fold hydrolase, partial [Rubrivivax sp.]|nr:alpha/beta fold hydrolase [Rubrivivax sp.]
MQIVANGVQLEVDVQGPEDGDPILLIMGLGMQLIGWPDELVQMLVQRGFRVIRHDNRDVGLSEGFDRLGTPNVMVEALRQRLRLRVRAPYQLADMAADALGVLDALGIEHAHVCGASMGGMIAQHIAAKHPRRVKSLTLIMTTSGARSVQQAHPRVVRLLLSRPRSGDAKAFMTHTSHVLSVIGSPAYPPEPLRLQQRLMASFARAYRPAGTARQLVAVAADGDRSPLLH